MRYLFLFLLPALVCFSSCKSEADKKSDKAKTDSLAKVKLHDQSLDSIRALQKMMTAPESSYNPRLAMQALKAYNDFTVLFPNDTLTPEFLFRAAQIAQTSGNYKQAVIFLEQILEKHHEYRGYSDACYAAANIYAQDLQKESGSADRAKTLFQFIIDHYPNTYYAESSKTLIQYIGMPDSVLVNAVLQKAGVDDGSKKKK